MAGGGSEHVCAPAGEGEEVVREGGKALKLTRMPVRGSVLLLFEPGVPRVARGTPGYSPVVPTGRGWAEGFGPRMSRMGTNEFSNGRGAAV
jgi:hypothetical protein